MSTLSIEYIDKDNNLALITFTACRIGNYLIAGKTSSMSMDVADTPALRQLASTLWNHKMLEYTGTVDIKLTSGVICQVDSTIWQEILNALVAFFIYTDIDLNHNNSLPCLL